MNNKLIFFITFIVAFCSLVYELIYSQLLTVVLGGTVLRYSITIGLFMFFLGVGSVCYNFFKEKFDFFFGFLSVEILLSFIGFFGAVYIILLGSFFSDFNGFYHYLFLVLIHLPVILVGFFSGLEIPYLVSFTNTEQESFSEVLGVDYFGGLIASVFFGLFLYPNFGLIVTSVFVSFLNLFVAGLFFLLNYSIFKKKKIFFLNFSKLVLVLFFIFYFIIFFNLNFFNSKVESWYLGENIFRDYQSYDVPVSSVEVFDIFSTPYQKAIFYDLSFENPQFNPSDKCMNLDNHVQMCEHWVKGYHNGLVDFSVSLFDKDDDFSDKEVLLIGGGDWIVMNYLRKYNLSVDMVDIDEKFFEFAKSYPFLKKYHNNSFEYDNYVLFNEDGFSFLKNNKKKYDLILLDLPGLKSDSLAHLYSYEFYSFVYRSLSDSGMAVVWVYPKEISSSHYSIYLNTLYKAGFREFLSYYGLRNLDVDLGVEIDDDVQMVEEFYVLKKGFGNEVLVDFNRNNYVLNFESFYDNLTFSLIDYNENFSYNSIFKVNLDMIVNRGG